LFELPTVYSRVLECIVLPNASLGTTAFALSWCKTHKRLVSWAVLCASGRFSTSFSTQLLKTFARNYFLRREFGNCGGEIAVRSFLAMSARV
jgi:hypothetical protein